MAVRTLLVKLAWPPLRRRLMISDLAPRREAGDSHDGALADPVKRFQLHHRLGVNGNVGPRLKSGAIIEKETLN
jgi:hypothetical protein